MTEENKLDTGADDGLKTVLEEGKKLLLKVNEVENLNQNK